MNPPNDEENPIITCTQRQLALVAWTERLGRPDLVGFDAWWDATNGVHFSSIREVCWKAWVARIPRHGDHERFAAWWQKILASRPVIS